MHAVIRTDLMTGTDVCPDLRSLEYMGAGSTATDIDNGNVVKLAGLMTGEREVWKAVTPAANDALKDIVIVANPEVFYDERKHNLDEFYTPAGTIARGYVVHENDIFSVTADALSAEADIEVGNIVELQAGTKLKVVSTATNSSTTLGKIIAIETAGKYTYYVIEIG